MARDRRNFTLEQNAHALLDGVGNLSEYVNKLIVQHGQDWTEALALLLDRSWEPKEIQAACESLRGYSLSNAGRDGKFLAKELERQQGMFTAHEVAFSRRARCFRQIAKDNALAHALATIAREYNLPNEACQNAVRQQRG